MTNYAKLLWMIFILYAMPVSANMEHLLVGMFQDYESFKDSRTGRWVIDDDYIVQKSQSATIGLNPDSKDLRLSRINDVEFLTRQAQPRVFISIPSKQQLRNEPIIQGDNEWKCLTEALYFEARGEKISGIFAVAEVILNRRDSKYFPNTVCAVISEGAHRENACQFSYKCDGKKEVYYEPKAKDLVGKIAQIALEKRVPNITSGATFYHANTVEPHWAKSFKRTATIGKHYFYVGS